MSNIFKFSQFLNESIFLNEDVKEDMRINDIITKSAGSEDKSIQLATVMANSIKDLSKAVRRYEASKQILGADHPVTKVFAKRVEDFGTNTLQETPIEPLIDTSIENTSDEPNIDEPIIESPNLDPILKKVKTLEELIAAVGSKMLIMHTTKDFHSELDARKNGSSDWSKIFIMKDLTQTSMNFFGFNYSGHGGLSNHDFMSYTKMNRWKKFENKKGNSIFDAKFDMQDVFDLFNYNRKRGNKIYIADSFLPESLENEVMEGMKETWETVRSAGEIPKTYGRNITEEYRSPRNSRGQWKKIPIDVVAVRYGYPYHAMTYMMKGKRYKFETCDSSGDMIELTELTGRDSEFFDIRRFIEHSNYYGSTNKDFSIYKLEASRIKTMNTLQQIAYSTYKSLFKKMTNFVGKIKAV